MPRGRAGPAAADDDRLAGNRLGEVQEAQAGAGMFLQGDAAGLGDDFAPVADPGPHRSALVAGGRDAAELPGIGRAGSGLRACRPVA